MKFNWTDIPILTAAIASVPIFFLGLGVLAGIVVDGFEIGRRIAGA